MARDPLQNAAARNVVVSAIGTGAEKALLCADGAVSEDVNRSQHRVASTNQHPARMGAKQGTPHAA